MDLPFDVNGWDYGKGAAGLYEFLAFLVDAQRIKTEHQQYGGKVVGLRLCERIAALAPELFFVPPWTPVSHTTQEVESLEIVRSSNPVIVRSSHADEDWVDPRAGVYASILDWEMSRLDALDEVLAATSSAILQECVVGERYIIDVAYSVLLEKVVVRVGIAHPNAPVAAITCYDTTTGKPFISNTGMNKAFALATVLPSLLEKIGVTFGVQLELIAPYESKEKRWALVQIRPSPDLLRGFVGNDHVVNGELLGSTVEVNQGGSARGQVLYGPPNDLVSYLSDTSEGGRFAQGYLEQARQQCSGKILFWKSPDPFRGIDVIYQACLAGSIGQISSLPIFDNMKHGIPVDRSPDQVRIMREAQRSGLIFGGLPPRVRSEIEYRTRQGEVVMLHLLCDGLVGQVYRV